MVEGSHDIDLINERLFSFFFTVSSLFRKSFHCILFSVFVLDDQINGSKVAFSDFFDGFEEFVETSLVDFFPEEVSPFKKFRGNVGIFEGEGLVVTFELQCVGMSEFHFTGFLVIVSFEVKDEIEVEVDFEGGSTFFGLG